MSHSNKPSNEALSKLLNVMDVISPEFTLFDAASRLHELDSSCVVLLLQPKYLSGHPENYLFSTSIKISSCQSAPKICCLILKTEALNVMTSVIVLAYASVWSP